MYNFDNIPAYMAELIRSAEYAISHRFFRGWESDNHFFAGAIRRWTNEGGDGAAISLLQRRFPPWPSDLPRLPRTLDGFLD